LTGSSKPHNPAYLALMHQWFINSVGGEMAPGEDFDTFVPRELFRGGE